MSSSPNVPIVQSPLLTIKEVGEILRVKTGFIDKAIRNGLLPPPIRIAGKRMYLQSDIAQFIASAAEKARGIAHVEA